MADGHHDSGHSAGSHGHESPDGSNDAGGHSQPNGLAIAADGLRLAVNETRIEAGTPHEWTFQVQTDEGSVVTAFEETHDQLAHLILVRRDLTRFQHLHPTLADDGTWTASFVLQDAGVYRAFVDVLVDGRQSTLGVDILSSGPAQYEARTRTTHTAEVEEYRVELTLAHIPAGETVGLEFEVRRHGSVAHLDPYLGALGHLVALRDGDLAYLHVHPEATEPADGVVRFAVRFPTSGRYRLFLQARPDGELITTSFDVHAGER